MGDTWITNIQHFLNDKGELPSDLPKPAYNLANHIISIIEEVTRGNDNEPNEIDVQCRRQPNRKKCTGKIIAYLNKENSGQIMWFCPFCDDNGTITGWESTIYNNVGHRKFN